MGEATRAGAVLCPLTERVLERLPGARVVWIAAWALVPWLNAGANLLLDNGGTSAVWEQSPALVVLDYAAISTAVVIALWGSRRIVCRLEALRERTSIRRRPDRVLPLSRAPPPADAQRRGKGARHGAEAVPRGVRAG